MKTVSEKVKFSWSAFFILTITYVLVTLFTNKLFDDLPWKEAFSLKNVLKESIGAIFFAFTFVLVMKPSRKRKSESLLQ